MLFRSSNRKAITKQTLHCRGAFPFTIHPVKLYHDLVKTEEIKAELPIEETIVEQVSDEISVEPEIESEPIASNNETPTMTNIPSPETGVNYKVQICAGHDKVDVAKHFNKEYQFNEESISTENHEGWIKYTIGAFDVYKEARDRRNVVTDGYSFPGPFVTAYNSGQRITVQEALMISNQKWIQ